MIRALARTVLGLFLVFTGTAHLTFARTGFQAQVPAWLPVDPDVVVLVSGVVEIVLGLALVVLVGHRVLVGLIAAAFFVAVFPGNVAQFTEQRSAFGLDTDLARGLRLLGQPVLVAWALWSTGAWAWVRALRSERRRHRPAGPGRP